jgi:hypothetical protein
VRPRLVFRRNGTDHQIGTNTDHLN